MMVLIKSESHYHVIRKADTVPKLDCKFIEKFINLRSVSQIYFHTCFATTDLLSKKAHKNCQSSNVWRSCDSTLLLYSTSDFR